MRRRAPLALLLAACGAPAPPPATPLVVASPAPNVNEPSDAPPPAPQPKQGPWLLVWTETNALVRCDPTDGPRAVCEPIRDAPAPPLTQLGAGTFATIDAAPIVWSAASGQRRPMATAPVRLQDGTLLRVEHLPRVTRVLRAAPGSAAFSPVPAKLGGEGLDHRFLPDGRHLFKRSPGMGGPESPYFVDMILGSSTTLHYAPSLDELPIRIASGPQMMHADFADEGRRVVFFAPGDVDTARREKTFTVETVAVDGKDHRVLGSVVTSAETRSAPLSVAYPNGRHFLHANAAGTTHGRLGAWRLWDVVSGADRTFGGALVAPFPLAEDRRTFRRNTSHVVTYERPLLRVLSLPELTEVMTCRFDDAPLAAEMIELGR